MFWQRQKPIQVVERALQTRRWKFHRLNDHMVLTGVRTSQGLYLISFLHHEDKRTLSVLMSVLLSNLEEALDHLHRGKLPVFCIHRDAGHSSDQVAVACERLMAKNYEVVLGRFERDPRDGEIRFGMALPYRDSPVTVDQINWAIDIGTSTLDIVLPEIYRLLRERSTEFECDSDR